MTGRMESVENPGEQRRGFASATTGFPPFPPSLGNRWRDSHIPTARRRRCSLTNLQTTNQGDTSTGLAEGTFLLGLDICAQEVLLERAESASLGRRPGGSACGPRRHGSATVSLPRKMWPLGAAFSALTVRTAAASTERTADAALISLPETSGTVAPIKTFTVRSRQESQGRKCRLSFSKVGRCGRSSPSCGH